MTKQTRTLDVTETEHATYGLQPERYMLETDELGTITVYNQDEQADLYAEIDEAVENDELDAIEVEVHDTNLTPDTEVRPLGVVVADDENEDDDEEPEVATDGGVEFPEPGTVIHDKHDQDKYDAQVEAIDESGAEVKILVRAIPAGERDWMSIDKYAEWVGQHGTIAAGEATAEAYVGTAIDGGVTVRHYARSGDQIFGTECWLPIERDDGRKVVGLPDDISRNIPAKVLAALEEDGYGLTDEAAQVLTEAPEDVGPTESLINDLLQKALSPGQAWAYYGVKVRGYSRNEWAKRCGYSDHSAVSEALRKAEAKLD